MDAKLLNECRKAARAHPHYPATVRIGIARSALALQRQKRELWDGDAIPGTDGCTLRITIEHDEFSDAPWDTMDCFGVPEHKRESWAREYESGYRVLDTSRHGMWVYPFADAVDKARKEFTGHSHYVEQDARRAVEFEIDYFRRFLADQWNYVTVTVEAVDEHGTVVASDSLGGVESDYDEQSILDHDMITTVCEQARAARPVSDFEFVDGTVEA